MSAEQIRHDVIETAKEMYRADGCDMPFDACLDTAARSIVPPHFLWHVVERNTAWTVEIWLRSRDTGDDI